MIKRLFILLSLIFGAIRLGFSQAKISYLFNQDMVDSCHKYINTLIVEVSNSDTSSNFRRITDISPVLKIKFFSTLIIQNTDIEIFNLTEQSALKVITLRNNSKLKTISNLSLLNMGYSLTLDNCPLIKNFEFFIDSFSLGHQLDFMNNPNLETLKINIKDLNYNNKHDIYISNNPKLKRVEIFNDKYTTRILSFNNNPLLDSILINKFHNIRGFYDLPNNKALLTAKKYLKFAALNFIDPEYEGSNFFAEDNANLKYIGGGFEKDSIILSSLYIKNNPQLNNLCVFQDIIKRFPKPDSTDVIHKVYNIENNAPGANSLEEVLTKDCSKQSELNHANTSDNLIIYPNPVKDAVYFKLPKQIPIDKCIIRNIEGKILHFFTDIDMQHSVQLPEITTGLYFFEIYSNGEKYVAKFMKE